MVELEGLVGPLLLVLLDKPGRLDDFRLDRLDRLAEGVAMLLVAMLLLAKLVGEVAGEVASAAEVDSLAEGVPPEVLPEVPPEVLREPVQSVLVSGLHLAWQPAWLPSSLPLLPSSFWQAHPHLSRLPPKLAHLTMLQKV